MYLKWTNNLEESLSNFTNIWKLKANVSSKTTNIERCSKFTLEKLFRNNRYNSLSVWMHRLMYWYNRWLGLWNLNMHSKTNNFFTIRQTTRARNPNLNTLCSPNSGELKFVNKRFKCYKIWRGGLNIDGHMFPCYGHCGN